MILGHAAQARVARGRDCGASFIVVTNNYRAAGGGGCLHGGGGNDQADGPHGWRVNTREWQAQQQLVELSSVLGPNRQHDLDAALVDQAHEQLQHILWSELARRWRQPSSSAALSLQTRERLLQSVDQWAQDNSTTPLRIDSLCEALEVPIWQLERAFLQTYGMAPQRLITLRRLAKARRALQLQTGSVTEVAMGHGFWHLFDPRHQGCLDQLQRDHQRQPNHHGSQGFPDRCVHIDRTNEPDCSRHLCSDRGRHQRSCRNLHCCQRFNL